MVGGKEIRLEQDWIGGEGRVRVAQAAEDEVGLWSRARGENRVLERKRGGFALSSRLARTGGHPRSAAQRSFPLRAHGARHPRRTVTSSACRRWSLTRRVRGAHASGPGGLDCRSTGTHGHSVNANYGRLRWEQRTMDEEDERRATVLRNDDTGPIARTWAA